MIKIIQNVKLAGSIILILAFCSPAFSQVDSRCYGLYEDEIKAAQQAIPENGIMIKFMYAQRDLRMKYFEPDPALMVHHQKFIDVWEAYERGIIDYERAMALTTKIASEGYAPSRPVRMKPC